MKRKERKTFIKWYGKVVEVRGTICGFRKTDKDMHENIETNNDVDEANQKGELIRPLYFYKTMTLIKNASVNGERIGDGHIWIPEDLGSLKGYSIGDEIIIKGKIRKYTRKNKSEDYCINAFNFYKSTSMV